MNKNTIVLPTCSIEIQKLTIEQFQLLRLIQKVMIFNKKNEYGKYTIELSEFGNLKLPKILQVIRENLQIVIQNKTYNGQLCNNYECTFILNDIQIKDEILEFRPADILVDIIQNQKKLNSKMRHLQNILFNGIRNKQALLFIDFLLSKTPQQSKQIISISIDEFKKILELDNDVSYKPYGFKKFVLDRIFTEINQKTQLDIFYDENTAPVGGTNSKKFKIASFNISFLLKG
ncbi:MAG: RepB family plasmid replication initiator protein [Bacilli bacterium]|nr:RepB family plasmid replication initiator protein [Bacilli bacterium]